MTDKHDFKAVLEKVNELPYVCVSTDTRETLKEALLIAERLQSGVEHPKNLTKLVDCGDGAVMRIIDPKSFKDGGAEWLMRYAGLPMLEKIRFTIASLLGSYDYILCGAITQAEAIRRLKLMRNSRTND